MEPPSCQGRICPNSLGWKCVSPWSHGVTEKNKAKRAARRWLFFSLAILAVQLASPTVAQHVHVLSSRQIVELRNRLCRWWVETHSVSRDFARIPALMAILPLSSLSQLAQLGAAVGMAGITVSANVADFLGALKDRLSSGLDSPDTKSSASTAASADGASGIGADVAVLQQQINGLLDAFHMELQRLLGGSGLNAEPAVQLTMNDNGRLAVSGDHPHAQQIESLVGENPLLGKLFRAISARQSLLQQIRGESVSNGPFVIQARTSDARPVVGV